MVIIIGLLVAFVLVMLFSNRATRQCRWREDRSQTREGLVLHRCAVCGAETYAPRGRPPRECWRGPGAR